MQWRTINTGLGNKAYSLWNNGRELLTLAYKPQTNRIYIEYEDGEKRHFKYTRKGLFKNKVVLENEYGTGLGKLKKERAKEYVIIDSKRFYLNFKGNKEVEILDQENDRPLAVCSLDVDSPPTNTKESLLMVFCYYLLGNKVKYEEPALAI